jgi:acyl-coenzyme A thioesterase PaaI-like protein
LKSTSGASPSSQKPPEQKPLHKPRVLRAYETAQKLPLGMHLFTTAVRAVAPYFLTVPAVTETLEPGRATVRMRHALWVRNHLGTVHAIALCNLAEVSMGLVAEATVPTSHAWIPKGMTVEYKAIARGTMHAVATLDLPVDLSTAQEVPVAITVKDDKDATVFTAEIRIWVRPKKAS